MKVTNLGLAGCHWALGAFPKSGASPVEDCRCFISASTGRCWLFLQQMPVRRFDCCSMLQGWGMPPIVTCHNITAQHVHPAPVNAKLPMCLTAHPLCLSVQKGKGSTSYRASRHNFKKRRGGRGGRGGRFGGAPQAPLLVSCLLATEAVTSKRSRDLCGCNMCSRCCC